MNTYIVITEKSPNADIAPEEFEPLLDDLISAIELNLPEGHPAIQRNGLELIIESPLNIKSLKESMEPAFSFHFGKIGYVSLERHQ